MNKPGKVVKMGCNILNVIAKPLKMTGSLAATKKLSLEELPRYRIFLNRIIESGKDG